VTTPAPLDPTLADYNDDDARAFRPLGCSVTTFKASLARLASAQCGLPVEVRLVQEIHWEGRFDGISACARLLHVPMAELPEVLWRLARDRNAHDRVCVTRAGYRRHQSR
jgi:hypothetical protein